MNKYALKQGSVIIEGWADVPPAGSIPWPSLSEGQTVLDIVSGAAVVGPVPDQVPDTVSAMQARIAMRRAGVLAEVEAIVTAAGQTDPEVLDAWNKAVEFRRTSPLIAQLNQLRATPMTDAELDALFIAAGKIGL